MPVGRSGGGPAVVRGGTDGVADDGGGAALGDGGIGGAPCGSALSELNELRGDGASDESDVYILWRRGVVSFGVVVADDVVDVGVVVDGPPDPVT